MTAPGAGNRVDGPVRQQYPDAHRIDLLDEALYQSFLSDISLFAGELRALPPGTRVFVDEIQQLPVLLNEVHRFIEDRRLKFILTGSSVRKLRRGGVNLLAGRALNKQLFPFLPAELGEVFQPGQALIHGTLPLIWQAEDKRETLKAYVQMYLKEEIKAEALVRNLPGFVRFLPVAALLHGQTINLASASREAGISRTSLGDYLEILEDTLLVFRLPACTAKLRPRERQHPKLYWIDPGLVRGVSNRFGELHPGETGALFEGLVAGMRRAYQSYAGLFDEMYY